MWLVGQSLLLTRARIARAVAARDPAPLLARARRQVAAGADALDLNAGIEADPVALAWAAAAIRTALPD
ncbi:MAG: dihydropteroate synthase, partial [Chloroflexi bacterium]|nr:dihydropteroate synthase [Chloroflexota bacterium]